MTGGGEVCDGRWGFGTAFRRADCGLLAKGKLVGRFKGRSADAADNGGAVSADEGVVDHACTVGAPQAATVLRHRRRWGFIGHSVLSLAVELAASEVQRMLLQLN
jgi:hypothetical protein